METQPIYDAIESFCDELVARAPEEVTPFLIGRKDRIKRETLRQSPERFVSENLVWPLLEAVDVDFITEAYLSGYNGQVDFLIQNTSHRVLGECKPFNHYKKAVKDLREYLGHRTTGTEFGVATDGVNWLFIREPGDRRQNVAVLEYHTFRPALFQYFLEDEMVSPSLEGHYVLWNSTVGEYREYGELRPVDIHESACRFISAFQPRNLDQQLESGAFDRTLDEFSRKSEDSSQENQTLDDFF